MGWKDLSTCLIFNNGEDENVRAQREGLLNKRFDTIHALYDENYNCQLLLGLVVNSV